MALPDLRNLGEMKPDPDPQDTHVLFDFLEELRESDYAPPVANPEARIRHSWAGDCVRALGYKLAKVEETNPPDRAALLTFKLGTFVHDLWQEAKSREPGVATEVSNFIAEIPSAGHSDAVDEDATYEVKSINGFGFKQAIGATSGGKAEGPRRSALLQGALNAFADGSRLLKIVYVSLEAISKGIGAKAGLVTPDRRMSAQWTFDTHEWLPLAEGEINRLRNVVHRFDVGEELPRHMPGMPQGARIINPKTGQWVLREGDNIIDTGSVWQCGYCSYQDRCIKDKEAGQ